MEKDLSKYTDIELQEELDRRTAARARGKARVRCEDCTHSSFSRYLIKCHADESKRIKSYGVWRVCKDFVPK